MTSEPAATVTVYDNGPLLIRGDFEIRGQDGSIVERNRATMALCRCGLSAIKPLCDGNHKAGGRAGARRPV